MAFSKTVILASVFFFIVFTLEAQVNRYMVFFKDKAGSPYTISNADQFLSPKAIARRIQQGIDINEQDIPVNTVYVEGVKQTGAETFFTSKWFNAILVQCDVTLVTSITDLPYVDHVEFVAPQKRLAPTSGGRTKFSLKKKGGNVGAETVNQLSMIGIDHMHQAGFKGEGMTIGIFDAGFEGVNVVSAFEHLFTEQKIDLELSYDFVYNTRDVFRYDDHGTNVLSAIAGDIPDIFTGGAPEANFQLYVTEDDVTEHRIEEYNWTFAAERADSSGVDIISSSLGYYDFDISSMNYTKAQMDGKTAVVTRAAQWAADRGMLVVCSAGNEGTLQWKIITAPADARDVLAVGAVDQSGARIGISSIGPAADGRIKPDVMARGQSVRVVHSNGNTGTATGTSLSAPLVTSLVAGVWQRYPELTNKEIMALIRESASNAKTPDNSMGYGIPSFKAVVNYYEYKPQSELFEIYPNPTRDTIVISPKDPEEITSCVVELVSPQGQILAKDTAYFSWHNRVHKADLSSLAKGIYYLRIWYQNKRYVFKVVRD